jgi:hypothetical protein
MGISLPLREGLKESDYFDRPQTESHFQYSTQSIYIQPKVDGSFLKQIVEERESEGEGLYFSDGKSALIE